MDKPNERTKLVVREILKNIKNTDPCLDEETLISFFEGNLASDETDKVEKHLACCEECAQALLILSDVEGLDVSKIEDHSTNSMKTRAQNLLPSSPSDSILEKITEWFNSFAIFPRLATVSAVLFVGVVGIYTAFFSNDTSDTGILLIQFGIIAQRPFDTQLRSGGQEAKNFQIENGGTLNSDDLIKIKFELTESAFVYLLALTGDGDLMKVYPESTVDMPQKLESQKEHFFPKNDRWLKLDDKPGKEKIYLLASPVPIEGFDDKINQINKIGADKIDTIFEGVQIKSFEFLHK